MIKVIVSTMHGEFNRDYFPNGDYKIIVVNQGRPILRTYENVEIINTNTVGLSKSRNIGLEQCEMNDIVVITDNDVRFINGFERIIYRAFSENLDASIITFKAKNQDGTPFKNYKSYNFEHTKFSIMKVSSIEIAIRKTQHLVPFDDNFGLGSSIPIGEENIFMSDNFDSNEYFQNEFICIHEDLSHSGLKFSKEVMLLRLKVFTRIYGQTIGRLVWLAFSIKKIRNIIFG
ncbi:glycosyltransferase family A protein [Vibrio cholerae]|nr:glycosyltransferase [Vibrio cholerae]